VLGLVVGRWWALLVPVPFPEVEVPGWFLGLDYGLIGAAGVGLGVALRRLARRAS
jgi:hypothetical protein